MAIYDRKKTDRESGGIVKGNNNQNDIKCLQIVIEIVIQRNYLRNFWPYMTTKIRHLPNYLISAEPDLKLAQPDPSQTHKHPNLDKCLLVVLWPTRNPYIPSDKQIIDS